MNPQIKAIGDLDRVIHEPARLMIVALLSEAEEADFLYLLRETGMSKGNLSSHLSRLEAAKYVEVTKTYRGKIQMTLRRLTDDGRAAFDEYRTELKRSLEAIAAPPKNALLPNASPIPALQGRRENRWWGQRCGPAVKTAVYADDPNRWSMQTVPTARPNPRFTPKPALRL